MDGSMDNDGSKPSDKSEVLTELKLENTMDTSGMWFAAVVLFAVMAAGIIIYRAANDLKSGLDCAFIQQSMTPRPA